MERGSLTVPPVLELVDSPQEVEAVSLGSWVRFSQPALTDGWWGGDAA